MGDPVAALQERLSRLRRARRAAHERLAALTGGPGRPVWEQAAALLSAGPGRPAGPGLAAFVTAAAGAAARAVEHEDPVALGVDRLLLAVGRCRHDRRDPAATVHLLAAAQRIPPAHPAAATVVLTLVALLDEHRPLSWPAGELADYTTAHAAATAPDPATAALAALCRTAAALTSAVPPDPFSRNDSAAAPASEAAPGSAAAPGRGGGGGDLAAFIGAVPAGHAWGALLAAAAGQAWLAGAVRSGDRAAVRAAAAGLPEALGGLAAALVALLDDDPVALRAAAGRIDASAERDTARVSAVAGALRLWLAGRPAARGGAGPQLGGEPGGGSELDAAIAALTVAVDGLDEGREPALVTMSWWRLAAAYRRRGIADDAARSRAAALRALRGAGQDAGSAGRFAGWMLAEGRPVEAFTALEVAAATRRAGGPVRSGAEPPAGDVLAVLLGVTPRAAPMAAAPARAEVAAAVRAAGAVALLYLHPTDTAGRTFGVLCLDPATDRLDVVANVPVTDPLRSDDPSWPSIVERWTDRNAAEPGRVIVAATGALAGLALPAVRTGSGRPLAVGLGVSQVASGADVVRLTGRPAPPAGAAPVFVLDPRGQHAPEAADALLVRRTFHPGAACLGQDADPSGARLAGASLLHLACGVRTAGGLALELAGGRLDLPAVPDGAGGLVILAWGHHDFPAVADAFLAAGRSGVIGWLRPVEPRVAALALFLVHARLAADRLPPGLAVSAVQRWMIDATRVVPPDLPPGHARTARDHDLTQPALWAPLTYRGC